MSIATRRALLYTTTFVIVFLLYSHFWHETRVLRPQSHVDFTAQAVALKVGAGTSTSQEILLTEPIALNYKTRIEVMNIRKNFVNEHRDLVDGNYQPFAPVFGGIEDYRPWWGIDGEFCYGPGRRSIQGPSEETRFFANPFLLLGLDEGKAFPNPFAMTCAPIFPHPVELIWHASEAKANVTYDIPRFFRERKRMSAVYQDYHTLDLVNYNARDFGYSFISASAKLSEGVSAAEGSHLFEKACSLQAFIHRGGSCHYPGGCNNASPYEPDLKFTITNVPGSLYCKLWKKQPKSIEDPADFIFVIQWN